MTDEPRVPVRIVPDAWDEKRVRELERGLAVLLRDQERHLPPAPEPIVLVFNREDLIAVGAFLGAALLGALAAIRIGGS